MRMLVLPVIVFTVGVASCERAPADAAQLIARVNGVEISAHEIRTNGGATVAQAVELDRDALVKDSIDNVRRQVLAQAYLERTAGGATRPSREEVRAFYAENPALFAERRVYRMRELVVSANAELVDALRSQATRAADLDEVAAWLKSRNVTFSAASETQPAEQLPLAFLPQMARMKAGEITVFQTPASAQSSTVSATVVQVVHAEGAPLALEQSQALIEEFLAGRRRLEVAAAEVKRLRATARIEYVAQFNKR